MRDEARAALPSPALDSMAALSQRTPGSQAGHGGRPSGEGRPWPAERASGGASVDGGGGVGQEAGDRRQAQAPSGLSLDLRGDGAQRRA